MNNLILFILLIPVAGLAQIKAETAPENNLTLVFDGGLMLGHSESYYPAPFSSNISFLYNYKDRIWLGGGSGAEVIGKTFIPLYADLRITPFQSKPFYIYEKAGWTVCANKNYSEGTENYNYYNSYPHPLNENINTKGGLMNEIGVGILMHKTSWTTSISIGYRYMKTEDSVKNSTKVYENSFNRLAIRLGFWF